ncbi:MAG: hypothetical protein KKF62_07220 [Bacteroidetes bacterium]|nr:hypothetical protein [Bacteroidota bacterium]MBU1114134.1 hypothetical protein [Bacteroidota bacterium]MBU1796800.1 hypothetical protein [Bacteroidota bacterium]
MKLLLENKDRINNPSANDIQNSLEQIDQFKLEFIILQKSKNEFLQCAKANNGKIIEYHNNDQKEHLRFIANNSEDEIILSIFNDFLNHKKINKNIINFENFSLEPQKDFTTYISKISYFLASIILIKMIWDTKFSNNSSDNLWGIDIIYAATIMCILMAIGFSSDLDEWEDLRIDSKSYVIGSIALAIFLSIISIIKLIS